MARSSDPEHTIELSDEKQIEVIESVWPLIVDLQQSAPGLLLLMSQTRSAQSCEPETQKLSFVASLTVLTPAACGNDAAERNSIEIEMFRVLANFHTLTVPSSELDTQKRLYSSFDTPTDVI